MFCSTFSNGSLGVDEVVVEDFLQRLERVPGLLLEDLVAPPRERLVVVGGSIFAQLADAGAPHFLVVRVRFAAALQLARDRFLLVDEQHHDVDGRLPEMDAERRVEELAPQRVHLVDEQLQALDLHVGAREAVDDHAVVILRAQQLAQQQPDDFAVADHVAGVLERSRLGRVEQRADDDRAAREAARLGDERRVGALAGAGRAAEQNDLLRETQVFAAEVGFEILPDRFEDQLGVLDLEIVELAADRVTTLWVHGVTARVNHSKHIQTGSCWGAEPAAGAREAPRALHRMAARARTTRRHRVLTCRHRHWISASSRTPASEYAPPDSKSISSPSPTACRVA